MAQRNVRDCRVCAKSAWRRFSVKLVVADSRFSNVSKLTRLSNFLGRFAQPTCCMLALVSQNHMGIPLYEACDPWFGKRSEEKSVCIRTEQAAATSSDSEA